MPDVTDPQVSWADFRALMIGARHRLGLTEAEWAERVGWHSLTVVEAFEAGELVPTGAAVTAMLELAIEAFGEPGLSI